MSSSFRKRRRRSSDLQGGSSKPTFPLLMLFPKDGGCELYKPPGEGKIKSNRFSIRRDFSGFRFLANSGNWFLVLDSGSNLSIVDVFSEKTIPLPSLESIRSSTSVINRVGDRGFVRKDPDCTLKELTSDDVSGLLWVDGNGKDYVVVWFFDNLGHAYLSFCKKGDTHYTDIPLFDPDNHWLDGLSEMVLRGYRLYVTTSRRYVRVLDLSGQDIREEGKVFPMLSRYELFDSSIAVTTSGEVLLVESDPCDRSWFRIYKYNPNLENPNACSHTVLEVDSLGAEALFLDLGFTVPANVALGIEPDSIYFTRHHRPCFCKPRVLDVCVFNVVTKTIKRFTDLDKLDLIDARWFLPSAN